MEGFISENILQILEIIGTILGLIYLYYQYRANSLLWIVNILMSAIYVFIYFSGGIYALGCISIYYILAAIYGLIAWKFFKNKEEKEVPISKAPAKVLITSSILGTLISIILSFILYKFTASESILNSTLDGFAAGISIISLYLLAKKYKEQWIGWIIADVISVILYIITGLYFTAGLYTLYIIVGVAGYKEWTKLMKNA